jgi:hypothetical protein
LRARKSRRAVSAELERVREIVACVTSRPVFASSRPTLEAELAITFANPVPLRLRRGGHLLFFMAISIGIEEAVDAHGEAALSVREYRYRLMEPDERELLAYHWHPHGSSLVTAPHMHLSSRMPVIHLPLGNAIALSDMHLPTGFVGVADIVRFLIIEVGVEPRRRDWEAVIDRLGKRRDVGPARSNLSP